MVEGSPVSGRYIRPVVSAFTDAGSGTQKRRSPEAPIPLPEME